MMDVLQVITSKVDFESHQINKEQTTSISNLEYEHTQ